MLETFERSLADYVGAAHAVAVSSGTAGLHLAVRAVGIDEGDAVITTPFSFVASANCVLYERATPIFVDIDPETLNIDPDLVEAKMISERTKAILPVHVFGRPCAMDRICEIADRFGVAIIEDACEALGAERHGRSAGTFGDLGVYAFYPNKQLTMGEGGVVVTDDPEHAALVKCLRNQGRVEGDSRLDHRHLGYNYRVNELSCALGLAQLERIDDLLEKRAQVAALYAERLADVEEVTVPTAPVRAKVSWFVYVVRLSDGIDRERVISQLAADGVPSRTYFPPIHLQPYMRDRFGFQPGDFPVTEAVSARTLALPFYGGMAEQDVEYVCDSLRKSVLLRQ